MRVLLTGSSGFVGTAFRRWFETYRPYDVLVCVDVRPPDYMRHPWVYRRRDVRSWFNPVGDNISRFDTGDGFDLVIHLAAVVGGRATIDGEPMAVATDLAIDADMWQWVLRARPRAVVYFSSSAAYPTALQTGDIDRFVSTTSTGRLSHGPVRLREDDIDLDDIAHPDAIYGLVKLVGEQQARHVAAALPGTRVYVFRPFSGYGVGQALDYPAPSIVERAVAREDPLRVWSDTVRDFVYVDDVVDAVMTAWRDAPAGTYNIASGAGVSFTHFAQHAARVVGYTPKVEVMSGMPSGVAYRVGDPSALARWWQPTINVDAGITRMVEAAQRAVLR